ncbi:hypothetical protein V6Z11_D07G048900 [Gossypium hirsutum]
MCVIIFNGRKSYARLWYIEPLRLPSAKIATLRNEVGRDGYKE